MRSVRSEQRALEMRCSRLSGAAAVVFARGPRGSRGSRGPRRSTRLLFRRRIEKLDLVSGQHDAAAFVASIGFPIFLFERARYERLGALVQVLGQMRHVPRLDGDEDDAVAFVAGERELAKMLIVTSFVAGFDFAGFDVGGQVTCHYGLIHDISFQLHCY